MNINNIMAICSEIKKAIDWDFDLFTPYQDMMNEIDGLVDKIIEEVKISKKEESTETLYNHSECYICGEVYNVNELVLLDNYYYYCEGCNNWRKQNNIPIGEFEGGE